MTKAIINGKRYNTETATLVAEWGNGLSYSDFKHCEESLYRSKKGSWFTVGSGGPMSRYARAVGNMTGGSSDVVRPITADEARVWLERIGDADAIERHFANEIEDA